MYKLSGLCNNVLQERTSEFWLRNKAKVETSLPGMDMRSSKLRPIQGIMLLFLLLVIPVGIYIFQTQNVGETRSKAMENNPYEGDMSSTFKRLSCARECPAGYVKVPNKQMPRLCDCVTIAEASGTPKPTNKSAKTPTPTKTIAKRCNTTCTSDTKCGDGMVCAKIPNDEKDTCKGQPTCSVCRNAQCYGVYDCWCYNLANVSPTPASFCNADCPNGDGDCGGSMICVRTADGNKCRNPQCYGVGKDQNCICYSTMTTVTPIPTIPGEITTPPDYYPTPTTYYPETYNPETYTVPASGRTFQGFIATPTPSLPSILLADVLASPTPNPLIGKTGQPILTVNPFYDAKKQTNPIIALSGTSDPDAEIDIAVTPDTAGTTVTADAMGNWQYVMPKLTNGAKQLTIIARAQSGGQKTKTDTFTVVGAFQFPFAAVVFGLLLVGGIGGYFWYMSRKNKKTPPNTPYISTTVPGFQQPEAGFETPSPYRTDAPSYKQAIPPSSVSNPVPPAHK